MAVFPKTKVEKKLKKQYEQGEQIFNIQGKMKSFIRVPRAVTQKHGKIIFDEVNQTQSDHKMSVIRFRGRSN